MTDTSLLTLFSLVFLLCGIIEPANVINVKAVNTKTTRTKPLTLTFPSSR
jgi:hypothetical protein